MIKIPKPKFVVFYNGDKNRPEVEQQKLSEAYSHAGDAGDSIELICTVYNINPNKNDIIKKKSYVLDGYMKFVEKVRELIREENSNAERVVERAVDFCIENDVLSDFFRERKLEVIKIMTIDMTFEAREKIFRREEREEGRNEGLKEGRINAILDFVRDGICTAAEGAKRLGLSEEEFDKLMQTYATTVH